MRIAKLAVVLLGLLVSVPALAEEGFKVVANNDVAADVLSRTQLTDLFLKRTVTWPGGATVAPVDLAEGMPAAEAFCAAIHRRSSTVIRSFWRKVQMSGRDTPPAIRSSDEEVVAFVRSNRGAIGYVSSGASTSGVKVIRVGN